VLVVEDDDQTRALLLALLRAHRFEGEGAATGESALARMAEIEFDLVLLDVGLPGRNGIEVLTAAHTHAPMTEFIMIAGAASVDIAVDAMKRGAYDFLRKPVRTDELLLTIDRALEAVMARREMARMKRLTTDGIREQMLGSSDAMEALWHRIEKVAPTRATVLITGESGVGKELVARAIHELSPRAHEPFVATNCSSLPETLLESELFGHLRGSFTGATSTRHGLFEGADRGTLFLDEVATISDAVQIKLLRVIQERVIQPVGSNAAVSIDFRLLAATNGDIAAAVARGDFREDLYYRLNVFPIRVPPLRERIEDLPALADHFVRRAAAQLGIAPPRIPGSTLRAMMAYPWPGNIRQLENHLESAVIAQDDGVIRFAVPAAPPTDPARRPLPATEPPLNLSRLERDRVLEALARTGGHRGRAADLLGISRRTIARKLKAYRTESDGGPPPA